MKDNKNNKNESNFWDMAWNVPSLIFYIGLILLFIAGIIGLVLLILLIFTGTSLISNNSYLIICIVVLSPPMTMILISGLLFVIIDTIRDISEHSSSDKSSAYKTH